MQECPEGDYVRFQDVEAERAETLKMFQYIEDNFGVCAGCPVCGNMKEVGHADDCALDALIKKLKGIE